MTHQTSPPTPASGIVPALLPTDAIDGSGKEATPDADVARPISRPRCARCGRRGRFVRHATLVHVRPRLPRRR